MQKFWLLIKLLIAFVVPPIVILLLSSWIISKYALGTWDSPYRLVAQLWLGALVLSPIASVFCGFLTYLCIRWYGNNAHTLLRYVSIGIVAGAIGGFVFSKFDLVTYIATGAMVGLAVSASCWVVLRLILGSTETDNAA